MTLAIWLGVWHLVAPEALLHAQFVQRTPGTYTVEQADAGLALYRQHCSTCHGETLDDGRIAPVR